MEMWLIYNDEMMAQTMGPITTMFMDKQSHGKMLTYKDVALAQGDFEGDIPYALRVEWYALNVVDGVEQYVLKGFWGANKTRKEALIAKYGSLDNI